MDALSTQLKYAGFSFVSESRLQAICEFLAKNDFECLADLDSAADVCKWEGVDDIMCEEVILIQRLVSAETDKGRARRYKCNRSDVGACSVAEQKIHELADRDAGAAAGVAVGVGPRLAVKRLQNVLENESDRALWIEEARVAALLGGCRRSLNSFRSGLRCWMEYAGVVLRLRGRELPPPLNGLLAWSTLFRNHNTFSNYLGHVRLGCELIGVSTQVFNDRTLGRAKASIRKCGGFVPRPRMFLRRTVLEKILEHCALAGEPRALGMLFLCTYVFLLRLPSEALPITFTGNGFEGHGQALAKIIVKGDAIGLHLKRRKNKTCGSTLWRSCWCGKSEKGSKSTCPVHVLGAYFQSLPIGEQPFKPFSASCALAELRRLLVCVGVANADLYRTHDWRRGHAKDLQCAGAALREILEAGEWRSPAFLDYLDLEKLEHDLVVEAHMDESSEGE